MNHGEWKDAIAERDDLAVENDGAFELARGRFDFGKAMRDVVERARVDVHAIAVAMNLRANAVVFVIDVRAVAEGGEDLVGIFFRLREHERERMKERHLRGIERVAFREQRRRADVAGEHIRAPHGIELAAERFCDR